MINCDTNGTDFSDEDDIFTITRDQGAQAALLYSLTSQVRSAGLVRLLWVQREGVLISRNTLQGCLMNEEYINDFEQVLDVYATTTISASRIIEQQFK